MKVPQWTFALFGLLLCYLIWWGRGCEAVGSGRVPQYGRIVDGKMHYLGMPKTPAPQGPRMFGSADPRLIRSVAETYDVPAGALYGLWQKGSGGLPKGNGSGDGWYAADDLAKPDGLCAKRFGLKECVRRANALVAICMQVKKDGALLCDHRTVRTTDGFALGPMLLLASDIVTVDERFTTTWTEYATDGDGDGIIDPFSLADAMATAAKVLKARHAARQAKPSDQLAWAATADRYLAERRSASGGPGIADHWQRWCAMPGNCGTKVVSK